MELTPARARGRVGPAALTNDDLRRELASPHRSRHETFRHETFRHETFRHGTDDALAHHDRRTAELERGYLRRFPDREVDPHRLRD
jgi:hypothetical protein